MLSPASIAAVDQVLSEQDLNRAQIWHYAHNLVKGRFPKQVSAFERLVEKSQSSLIFEAVVPSFLLPPLVSSREDRITLAATFLASVGGVLELDRRIDSGLTVDRSDDAWTQALWWAHELSARNIENEWSARLESWTLPAHGVTPVDSKYSIVLRKNPFYPDLLRSLRLASAPHLGDDFTVAVGLIDDALDLQLDIKSGAPNSLLGCFDNPLSPGPTRQVELVSEAFQDAKERLSRCFAECPNAAFAVLVTGLLADLDDLWSVAQMRVFAQGSVT